MAFSLSQWRTMPATVAAGIGFWALSWLFFLIYIYTLTRDSNWIAKLVAALVVLSIFLLRGGNWARIIALMSNGMSVLFLTFLAFTFLKSNNGAEAFLIGGNLAAFCVSTYFLLVPGTVDFFRKYSAVNTGNPKGKEPRDLSS